jgi:hypothetical protein
MPILHHCGGNTNYMLEVVKEDGIMGETYYRREHCGNLLHKC